MNTKKLLLTAGLVALAGTAQAVPTDVYKASLLMFPDIEAQVGRTTLVQISNFGAAVHIQCYYQTADKVKGNFSFDMSRKETRVFDVKSGVGQPGNVAAQFPPIDPLLGIPGLPEGMLVCLAVETNDDNGDGVFGPIDHDGTNGEATGLIGTARVVQYNLPGWATEYQAWTMRYNAGGTFGLNPDDYTAALTFGVTPNTYEQCARTMIGNILTRNSAGASGAGRGTFVYAPFDPANPDHMVLDEWDLGTGVDSGTLVVDANHLFVAVCAQALQEGAPMLHTKLIWSGFDENESDMNGWQCGDSWYDINLGTNPLDAIPYWGSGSGWGSFVNVNDRWAVQYQLNMATRLDAYRTCRCTGSGVAGTTVCPPIDCEDGETYAYPAGCPNNEVPIPSYRLHPGTNTAGVGLWATQRSEFFLTPAGDQDAASSNLFSWRDALVNGYIYIDLTAAKQ